MPEITVDYINSISPNVSAVSNGLRHLKKNSFVRLCISDDEALARRLSQIGIPCFACTPRLLPELLEGALKGFDLNELEKRVGKRN